MLRPLANYHGQTIKNGAFVLIQLGYLSLNQTRIRRLSCYQVNSGDKVKQGDVDDVNDAKGFDQHPV
jgi:hypothetical protein